MEPHTVVVLKDPAHLFAKHPFTHTVDHDQLAFAIADRRLQGPFEVGQLVLQLLALAQPGLILHQFVQV